MANKQLHHVQAKKAPQLTPLLNATINTAVTNAVHDAVAKAFPVNPVQSAMSSSPSAVTSSVSGMVGQLDPTGELTKLMQGQINPADYTGPDGQAKLMNLQNKMNQLSESISLLSNIMAAFHSMRKHIIDNIRD